MRATVVAACVLASGLGLAGCTPSRTTGNAPRGDGPGTTPAASTTLAPLVMNPAPTDGGVATVAILPPDRTTTWNPGLNAVKGIPSRTVVYKTLGPSGLDDTAAIQAALETCPAEQVVQLDAGTFHISGQGLTLGRSNVVLRGRGPDKTRLVKGAGSGFPVVILGKRWPKYTAPTDLAVDGVKGRSQLTLAQPLPLAPGDLVVVDQVTDPALSWWGAGAPPGSPPRGWFGRPDRPLGQVLEVEKADGATVTFTTPLHIDFKRSNQAQVVRFAGDPGGPPIAAVRYAGLEDLYVARGEGGDGGGNIHLFATAYSWVKNVESDLSAGTSINLDGTFRCEVRDSYIHSTVNPNPGGDGYGVGVNSYAADNLVENNAIWNFNKVDVFRASGGGNVFGYNYLEDGYGAGYRAMVEVGLNASHFTTPHFELFEGNVAFNFDSDSVWGNSIYITVFRNHFTGKRRSAPPLDLPDEMNRRAVGLTAHHWWYSFVGNVLGTEGQKPAPARAFVYEKNDAFGDWSAAPMWKLGYDGNKWSPAQDAKVVATTIRHANFDYVSEKVVYDPRLPRQLPASLYLAGKPAFLVDAPWPLVDPERTPKVGALPARKRFDAMHSH